jgi:predicted kinase
MSQPVLYMFVGYPGAGKTTVAQLIHKITGAEHIWADKERHERFGSKYRAEDSAELYNYLNEQTSRLLSDNKSVIFDTNFNFFADRAYLRDIAAKNGAVVKLVWLTTPKELAYQRAVAQPNNDSTRLYTSMTHEDFERIASRLEPPTEEEQPITIDGTVITREVVANQICDI